MIHSVLIVQPCFYYCIRIQANYVLWRAAAASVSYLTEELRKRQLEYSTELSGRTEREPRWKECVDISSGSFSLAIGSLYVRRYFDEDAKKNALEMVNGIREEMYKILSSIDWMDEKTRYIKTRVLKPYHMDNKLFSLQEKCDR